MGAWWVWVIIGVILLFNFIFFFSRKRIYYSESERSTSGSRSTRSVPHVKKKKKKRKQNSSPAASSKKGSLRESERSKLDDDSISSAIRDAVRTGLLMSNIPTNMIQGRKERVEVKIGRSSDFREELISELHGRGVPQFEEIDTSFYMEVRLAGPTFEVICHSPSEQLILPTPASWNFDVLPSRAGRQKITLYVTMRIEVEGIVSGRRGVSSLEKQIDIKVNISFAGRRFVTGNWQWLIPTILALAGTIAAWLVVPF